jgi:hypothetical protein
LLVRDTIIPSPNITSIVVEGTSEIFSRSLRHPKRPIHHRPPRRSMDEPPRRLFNTP